MESVQPGAPGEGKLPTKEAHMTHRMLWIGIPLLTVALAGGGYTYMTVSRGGEGDTPAQQARFAAGVLAPAPSCCASQATTPKTAGASDAFRARKASLTPRPQAGSAAVASTRSCDVHEAGTNAGCAQEQESHATSAIAVRDEGVCPVTGARLATADAAIPKAGTAPKGHTTKAPVVARVASATK
jgi:hypothetical protein